MGHTQTNCVGRMLGAVSSGGSIRFSLRSIGPKHLLDTGRWRRVVTRQTEPSLCLGNRMLESSQSTGQKLSSDSLVHP